MFYNYKTFCVHAQYQVDCLNYAFCFVTVFSASSVSIIATYFLFKERKIKLHVVCVC